MSEQPNIETCIAKYGGLAIFNGGTEREDMQTGARAELAALRSENAELLAACRDALRVIENAMVPRDDLSVDGAIEINFVQRELRDRIAARGKEAAV